MLASLQQRLALAGRPGDEVAPQPAYLRRHVLVPVVVLAVLVLAGLAAAPIPGAYALLIASEQGIVENASALIALAGLVPAVAIMRHPGAPRPWLPMWAGCFVIGLAFIAAEEVSWGQQWFFWDTPDWIGAVNTQNETNFHNYAKWSEDLPKTVLSLAVLATGILWPLWVLLGGRDGWIRRTPLHWIWPSAALWPSAVIAFGLRIAERLVANLPGADSGAPVFRSLREGLELFLILFVVAYLVDLRARLGRR